MDQNTAEPRRGNSFGVASLIAGIVLLALGVLNQSLAPAIPMIMAETSIPFSSMPLLYLAPPAIVATIGTALGIVGLLVRNRSRDAAIIGTTFGVSHLVVGLAGIIGAQIVIAMLG